MTCSSAENAEPVEQLGLDDALALAVQLHRVGDLTEAETLYRRILEIAPVQADAMHFLGVLLHRRDRSEEAVDLIQRSIEIDPQQPDRYNNLGNVLLERGRLAEATEAYRSALARQPEHADAWNNLGALLREQRRYEESEAAYRKAIEIDPGHVDAYNNYGNLLSRQGRVQEAVAQYYRAMTLVPNHPESRRLLGIAYCAIGEVGAAAEIFGQWLQDEPENPIAAHLYAACSGSDVPARASDAYIERSFDNFADSFDGKLARLAYRAPQWIGDVVARLAGEPARQYEVLDAGCGTGLCGPRIAPWARRLSGVDLSGRMLAQAQGRGCYDELTKGELTAYLEERPGALDLLVCADTMVYFGPLERFARAARRALRSAGLLIFTVEKAPDDMPGVGYRLNPHGRYSHRREYIRSVLIESGFQIPILEVAVLRMEGGQPVAGVLVAARATAGAN